MTRILLLLAFVFSAMDISAQEASKGSKTAAPSQSEPTAQAIVHVDQFLQSLQSKGKSASRVKSLVNDAQPSVYVENGTVKAYGQNPLCVFTDVRSFANLGSLGISPTVEIVTVKFKNQSDFATPLDLSVLSALPRVQYVYLVSEVNVPAPKVISAVKNLDPKYGVFYNIPTLH